MNDSIPWCTLTLLSLLKNSSEGCLCVPCGHARFLGGTEFKLLMVKTDGFVVAFFFSASFFQSATECVSFTFQINYLAFCPRFRACFWRRPNLKLNVHLVVETGSQYMTQDGLELDTFLLSWVCWDTRYARPWPFNVTCTQGWSHSGE